MKLLPIVHCPSISAIMMKTAEAKWEMAYSDFTLQTLKKDFGLQVDEQANLFASVEPVASSDLLNTTLRNRTTGDRH